MTQDNGAASAPGGVADGADLGDGSDGAELGAVMVRQLGVLLDGWVDEIGDLVAQGLDPTPLLEALARVLRSAADQLDGGPDVG